MLTDFDPGNRVSGGGGEAPLRENIDKNNYDENVDNQTSQSICVVLPM